MPHHEDFVCGFGTQGDLGLADAVYGEVSERNAASDGYGGSIDEPEACDVVAQLFRKAQLTDDATLANFKIGKAACRIGLLMNGFGGEGEEIGECEAHDGVRGKRPP